MCADTLQMRRTSNTDTDVTRQLVEFLVESIEATRSLTFELSPPILYDIGLAAALQWLGRWMKTRHGLTVTVNASRLAEPKSEAVRRFSSSPCESFFSMY